MPRLSGGKHETDSQAYMARYASAEPTPSTEPPCDGGQSLGEGANSMRWAIARCVPAAESYQSKTTWHACAESHVRGSSMWTAAPPTEPDTTAMEWPFGSSHLSPPMLSELAIT